MTESTLKGTKEMQTIQDTKNIGNEINVHKNK